jgi:hypothetical protein
MDASLNPMYGRFGLAGLTGFVAVGLATAPPGRTMLSVGGALLAVAAALPLFLFRPLVPVAWAAASTVGVVLVANGDPGSLAWFAVCVLGGWCALGAATSVGVAYWTSSLVLFGAEWLLAVQDPGWGAWAAGVSFTVLAALLIRHQLALVDEMRSLVDRLERAI